jgi:ATP-binding cassette, subfamily F, member 3
MILAAEIKEKSFGSNKLYSDVAFEIQDGEIAGLIGRNGTGKSTLFNIINGEDKDFQGELKIKRGAVVVSSRQEHHGYEDITVSEYIQGDLPDYKRLTHIIDTYPDTMGTDQTKMQNFSDALIRFGELGYYQIEDELKQMFETYQLDPALMHRQLGSLSGGQKRMAELIKVQRSRGHIALIDEPTNHMDYVAKRAFIKWLRAANEAVLVITHDRDVLDNVDRIIEIRDGKSYVFKGNYNAYLKTNKGQITSEVSTYDQSQKRMITLEQDIVRFRRMKEKSRTPGTIRRFKSQEQKAKDELQKLSIMEKPSFWIDQESASTMHHKMTDTYDKYKATNIKVRTRKATSTVSGQVILRADKLSLGYSDKPLFSDINFGLRAGERLRLHGRNGAGKTTLISAIMSQANGSALLSQCFAGTIEIDKKLRIGHYEQEIDPKYLKLRLADAIEQVLRDKGLPVSVQKVKQLLSDYLFNPAIEGDMPVNKLSGGQKARLQIISMLVDDPQILILDEPTNHLDLPSIEELENALMQYHGAIVYISHDSFLAGKLGGETVMIGS